MEVDAKYIKGMLNEPDLWPNAAINRWIQGILMFHFTPIHVPATKHVGPDALSRRSLGEGEIVKEDDDTWLDDIALLTQISQMKNYLHLKYIIMMTPLRRTSSSNSELFDGVEFLSEEMCENGSHECSMDEESVSC